MAVIPVFSVLAVVFFMVAARTYDHDVAQVDGVRLASAAA